MLKNPNHIQGPTGLMVPGHLNFGDFILERLWALKDKTAVIDASTNESITYGEILQQSMNFAVSLTRMGVRKGHIVGLMSENRMEYWSAVIGVICTGAAVATISPDYKKDELINALTISKPKIVICSPNAYKNHINNLNSSIIIFGDERINNSLRYKDLAEDVQQVKYQDFRSADVLGQTDTLFILYSSGTTGLPKGVKLTHLNILIACCLPISHNPAMTFSVSPWYHTMGLVGFITGFATGRTRVFLPKFEVDLYLKTIEKYKISQLTVVPPVLVAVTKWPGKYDLSSVRTIFSGAAPLHKETLDAVYLNIIYLFILGFRNFTQYYKVMRLRKPLGVIKFNIHELEAARRKPGSVGRVVQGVTIKIADINTNEALGPNRKGEICVKGAMLMSGYVGMERGEEFDDEGFYRTGDIGYYDEGGFFYVVDRLKELIKYKGFQVPPAELEALLLTLSSVKDVGVIGIPHESGGEVPLAFVVVLPRRNVTEKELQEYVAESLSNPKHLRGGVRFVEQIPKSQSGKILRNELRKLFKAGKSKL